MSLKLSLKPGERVAINGAVIVNSDRRADIAIENQARILRESDIMQPEEATSPARRLYFSVMLLYLEPDGEAASFSDYERRLTEFADALLDPNALKSCTLLSAHVANGAFYRALQTARDLIAFEETRLGHVA